MLLSYDPDIYCNPHSSIFDEVYTPVHNLNSAERGPYKVDEGKSSYTARDVIESIIAQLEKRNIDITSSYTNWIKVGFALCTTFREGG
jgi:hypothetical protein